MARWSPGNEGSRADMPPHVVAAPAHRTDGRQLPHGQSAGYLGKTFDPFLLDADPNERGFKVPDLLPPDYVSAVRQSRRRSLRSAIEGDLRAFEASSDARLLDASFEGAYKLVASPQARQAFEISAEPEALRDRYGRTRFGQSCLLARRLIERGVRFVTVNMFETVFNEITWDIHGSAPFSPIECYKNQVGPNFDNAYSALLEDLKNRGMLETTMVLAFGEFGRTPKINPAGGRDHHPACWTALFAGGRDQGRSGGGRIRRDRLCAQGPTGHARRDRGNGLSRTGHRPGDRASRPARTPHATGRSRRRADLGIVLTQGGLRFHMISVSRLLIGMIVLAAWTWHLRGDEVRLLPGTVRLHGPGRTRGFWSKPGMASRGPATEPARRRSRSTIPGWPG